MTRTKLFSITKADLTRQTFRAGGPGGQNQNARSTGVRFIHEPSGARGEARDQRSQAQNERLAFERLCRDPRLKAWIQLKAAALDGQPSPDERAEEWMDDKFLEVHVKDDKGRWTKEQPNARRRPY